MINKYKLMLYFSIAICIVLTGCGSSGIFNPGFTATPKPSPTPTPINDDEFVETAQEVCNNLKKEIDSLDPFILFDLKSKADVYRKAADALAHLSISEESAPLSTHFLSSINDIASSYDKVGEALAEAITKAGLDESNFIISITQSGSVVASSGNINELQLLEVDNTLITELLQIIKDVNEAAISLNLEDCAIEN